MARTLHQGMSEQAKASRHRLDDARALFNGVRWRGSMYLAGYAIECLLKAKLMRMFGCHTLSDLEDELRRRNVLPANATVFSHQLEPLMGLAQSLQRLKHDRELWAVFNMVNRWVPAWRYSPDLSNKDDAGDFLEAVEQLLKWIENNV
jgi:HEPN domain-containing protein